MNRQITFKLDQQKVLDVLKMHAKQNSQSRKILLRAFLLWLGILIVTAAALFYISDFDWATSLSKIILPITLFYWFIVVSALLYKTMILIPKRQKRQIENDKQVGLEQTWIWDDKAVAIRNSYMKGTYPFRLFYNWREFPDFIALYLSEQKFYIVPKNALNAEQLQDLKTILNAEIKGPNR